MGESSMLPVLRSPLTCEVMDFGNHEFQLQNNGLSQLGTASPDGNCRKTGYVQTQTIPVFKRKFVRQRSMKSCILRLFVDIMWTQNRDRELAKITAGSGRRDSRCGWQA